MLYDFYAVVVLAVLRCTLPRSCVCVYTYLGMVEYFWMREQDFFLRDWNSLRMQSDLLQFDTITGKVSHDTFCGHSVRSVVWLCTFVHGRLLQEDPVLFQLYKDLVVANVITAEEFWANRFTVSIFVMHKWLTSALAGLAKVAYVTKTCSGKLELGCYSSSCS